jgi:hypothetical protein
MYPHAYPQGPPQQYAPPQTEEWILLNKELHFGYIKETFRRGAVITHDITNRKIIVDGRPFDDTRDIDILKRMSLKNPQNPWIIPYSPESLEAVRAGVANPMAAPLPPRQEHRAMEVVSHDTSDIDPIPIGHTRVAANNAAAKAAAKNAPMEIIRGDETVEERIAAHASSVERRIAELEGKTDIGSIAERAKLKANHAAKMPIVRDDSLGHAVGSRSASRNAGQPLPSPEEAEMRRADAAAMADARKRQVESTRQAQYPPQQPYQQPYPPQQAYPQAPPPQPPEQVPVPDASQPAGIPGLYDEVSPVPAAHPAPAPAPPMDAAMMEKFQQFLAFQAAQAAQAEVAQPPAEAE